MKKATLMRLLVESVRRGGRIIAVLACLGLATACGPGSAEAPQSGGTPVASGSAVAPAGTPGAAKVRRADLLNGIFCTGQECTAVGGYYYGTSAEHTLAELWTGSAWQVEPSPDAPRYSSLQAFPARPLPTAWPSARRSLPGTAHAGRSTATGACPVSAPAGGRRSPQRICPCRARPIPADCRPGRPASLFLRPAAHRGRATSHHRR